MEWATYRLEGVTLVTSYVSISDKLLFLKYPCYSTSVCYPYVITLAAGAYTFECYGAGGGEGYHNKGGPGGYSTGSILLDTNTTFYVYVGGRGSSRSTQGEAEGGYNGGGKGIVGTRNLTAGGGGGATEIRMNYNSLDDRIIVAGGGGGAGSFEIGTSHEFGGEGGGEEGDPGGKCPEKPTAYVGLGANQTHPGNNTKEPECKGHLNLGGIGYGTGSSGGGGGGGYFGGGGGKYAGGGGGSGYVGGVTSQYVKKITKKGSNSGNGFVIINRLIPGQIKMDCSPCRKRNPPLIFLFLITIMEST